MGRFISGGQEAAESAVRVYFRTSRRFQFGLPHFGHLAGEATRGSQDRWQRRHVWMETVVGVFMSGILPTSRKPVKAPESP